MCLVGQPDSKRISTLIETGDSASIRPVLYAYRPLVEAELERMTKQGVIMSVEVAEYTTTLVGRCLEPVQHGKALRRFQGERQSLPERTAVLDANLQ